MQTTADRYIDLLKRTLTRIDDPIVRPIRPVGWKAQVWAPVASRLNKRGFTLTFERPGSDLRGDGRDWPAYAETMVGMRRLDNVQHCVETVLADNVDGDLLEAGVWRGGTAILMRALLEVRGDTGRTVIAADSYEGLPAPTLSQDDGLNLHEEIDLAVGVDEVKANFERYGYLDERTRFLVGWFKDTLPGVDGPLAVARLDGDLYESTRDALDALYPKLSPGGFLIVDDYNDIPACKLAVDEYRDAHGISEQIEEIDWTGVFWRKQAL